MKSKPLFAYNPEDTNETKLEKFSTLVIAGSCSIAGIVWSLLYFFTLGWGITAALPLFFSIVVSLSLIYSHQTKNHIVAIYTQIISIIYITTFIQWSIGGIFDSGFVMVWAFIGPITALMFFPFRKSIVWFILYAFNILITVQFDDYFASNSYQIDSSTKLFYFLMNLIFFSLVVFIFTGYFISETKESKKRETALKKGLSQLKVIINKDKRDTELSDIVNSDFFKTLLDKKNKRKEI